MSLFLSWFLCEYLRGEVLFYLWGGDFLCALVCDFDLNLCEKNGGDYVMVIFTLVVLIWELLYVASRLLSSTGNICLREL